MSCKRLLGWVLPLLLLGLAADASADEVTVLPVGFAEAPATLLGASLRRAVSGLEGAHLIEPADIDARLAERYPEPADIDADWVAAQAIRGEEAYYEMSYAAAAEVFETEDWRSAQVAIANMALDPSLAESVRRGLMIRAGAHFYSGDTEATEGAVRELVALFPQWTPNTDWYQPELVVAYTDIRHVVLRDAGEITLTAPRGDCVFSLNGLELGHGSVAVSPALEAPYAALAQCGDAVGRVQIVRAGSSLVDPDFDAALDPATGVVVLPESAAEQADQLARVARAWAALVGAEFVVLAGVVPSGELELAALDVARDGQLGALRAEPDEGGAFDVVGAMSALWDGTEIAGVEVAERDDDRLVWASAPPVEESGGINAAPWIAFGVGGAGLIFGAAFAIIESSRYDDFTECRQDPVCASSPELDSLEQDRDRAAILATVGFGVGLAGVITGTILLVVQSSNEPELGDTASLPRVTGMASENGGWVGLDMDW